MRVLITGVTGMAGSHMAEWLLARGDCTVFGTFRRRSRMDNLETLKAQEKVNIIEAGFAVEERADPTRLNLLEANLADAHATARMIAAVRPDRIFHLAAQSFVPTSWIEPAETLNVNVIGQVNLLEAVRLAGIMPRIHIAGSSEQYGLVHEHEVPIRETNPLRPLSPYAVSKVGQEMLAYQYTQSYGIPIITTRGFNHTGPRRGDAFVTSSFAKQIAEIEAGWTEPVVYTGDLTSVRDWTDVRDMIRAYWLILEHGEPGEVYNIASGTGHTVGQMLQFLIDNARVAVEVRQDPARMRPSDVRLLLGNCDKMRAVTGWQPEIPFEQTMIDLLDYWRDRLARMPHERTTVRVRQA